MSRSLLTNCDGEEQRIFVAQLQSLLERAEAHASPLLGFSLFLVVLRLLLITPASRRAHDSSAHRVCDPISKSRAGQGR